MNGVRKYNLARYANDAGGAVLREFLPEIAHRLEAAGGYELIAAYDARDVDPLVEALRKIASCESRVPGDVVDIARRALAPFEEEK